MSKYVILIFSFYQGTNFKVTCDALRDLVPFVQFKKREKHPWRRVTFSKVETLLKVTLLHGCFSRFSNCANGTKSRKASHIICRVGVFPDCPAGILSNIRGVARTPEST